MVDMRASIMNINTLNLLTKDNVTVRIDAFCQYKIKIPELAIFKVADFRATISFMVQGTLKAIVAENTLDE